MSTQNRLFTAMTPSFSVQQYKAVPPVYSKTHLSGPPMPKFKANMNYIPPSPPSSMEYCNKSATVKFHMDFFFDYYDPAAISHWCDTIKTKEVK